MKPLAVAVLASGHGTNLKALLDAQAAGDLPARVVCVVSDRADTDALGIAHGAGIPAEFIDPARYTDRAAWDAELLRVLDGCRAGLVVMAGFMRILGSAAVQHWHGKMLNIHPSLLPKYRGLHTHRRVLEAAEAEHGASVHFVTEELDGGPVVVQTRLKVASADDEASLASRVRALEHRIYPWAVKRFAEGRLKLEDGVVYDGKKLAGPLQVNRDTQLETI